MYWNCNHTHHDKSYAKLAYKRSMFWCIAARLLQSRDLWSDTYSLAASCAACCIACCCFLAMHGLADMHLPAKSGHDAHAHKQCMSQVRGYATSCTLLQSAVTGALQQQCLLLQAAYRTSSGRVLKWDRSCELMMMSCSLQTSCASTQHSQIR